MCLRDLVRKTLVISLFTRFNRSMVVGGVVISHKGSFPPKFLCCIWDCVMLNVFYMLLFAFSCNTLNFRGFNKWIKEV